MTVAQDLTKAVLPAIVELWKLDANVRGQGMLYLCGATNELGKAVVLAGNTYTALPIVGSGFAKSATGAAPRPTLTIDNTNRLVQAAVIAGGDLVGSTIQRVRIFSKYLDAVNFAGGNPNADPTQLLSMETYLVDRKTMHNNRTVQFELCWVIDQPGVQLPDTYALSDEFPGLSLNRA